MFKNSDIFDFFGINGDAFNKLSELSLKDYIKDNEHITGAFNELSAEKKKQVVDSMNKIQNTFAELFGTKKDVFTEEDFVGSKVNVSSKSYDSTKDDKEVEDKKENKKEESKYTFVEAPKVDVDNEEAESEFDIEGCKGCDSYNDCLKQYNDSVDDEFEDDCDDDWDDEDYDESDDEYVPTICDELLAELEDEDTPDEELVDSIVEYVLAILGEKKNKKYTLHPGTDTVPPAVEVKVPKELATADIIQNIHIMTLLRDVLVDTTGAHDAYINQGENNSIVVYIPLKKI